MSRNSDVRRILHLLLLLIFFFNVSVHAQRGAIVTPVNLEQLTARSATIIRGKIVSVRVEPHPQFKNLKSVLVTVAVNTSFKGPQHSFTTFRQYLWDSRDIRSAGGYRVNQEVMLFLNRTTEIGFTSPVGLHQGRFLLEPGPDGRLMAANQAGNSRLFKGMSSSQTLAKASARTRKLVAEVDSRSGPLPVDALEELVRGLLTEKRAQ